MRNTGKASEKLFDDAFKRLGKGAYVYAFTDASKATGKNKRVTIIDAQPSDRIVVLNGETHFAEVKSTYDERNFPFSLLRKGQSAFARMILAAGGEYIVYLHALAHNQWYRIPYSVIKDTVGRSSIPYADLENYKWSLPCIPM